MNSSSSNIQCEHIELIKRNSSHWEIVFNRPEKYNAITSDMYECLTNILDQAENDPDLVLLTMTGKGKFYSAGTDLSEPMKSFVCFSFISSKDFLFFFDSDDCNNRYRNIN